jgi:hypothetical protein
LKWRWLSELATKINLNLSKINSDKQNVVSKDYESEFVREPRPSLVKAGQFISIVLGGCYVACAVGLTQEMGYTSSSHSVIHKLLILIVKAIWSADYYLPHILGRFIFLGSFTTTICDRTLRIFLYFQFSSM